jgi:predicted DCC family thiol-disulfide oxidoreductase YuxK
VSGTLPPPPQGRPVVLYDGACGWCIGWAGWLVRHDRAGRFLLAPLAGETAARYLGPSPPADTMALVVPDGSGARVLTHAAAVRGVLMHMGGPWPALALLGTLLGPFGDVLYRWIARRRHALPAGAGACDPDAVPQARRLP